MANIKTWNKSFTSEMVLEGSWGSRKLGRYASTMELTIYDDHVGCIEWDIPELETTEHIGLWFETTPEGKLSLSDYDGVFCLPIQAIHMIEEAGIIVEEIFH